MEDGKKKSSENIERVNYETLSFKESLIMYSLLSFQTENNTLGSIDSYKDIWLFPSKRYTDLELTKLLEKSLLQLDVESSKFVVKQLEYMLPLDESSDFVAGLSILVPNISRNGVDVLTLNELSLILRTDLKQPFLNYEYDEIEKFYINTCALEAASYVLDSDLHYFFTKLQTEKLIDTATSLLKIYTLSQVKGIIKINYKYVIKNRNFKSDSNRINKFLINIKNFNSKMKNFDRYSKLPMCLISNHYCKYIFHTTEDYYTKNVYEFWSESTKNNMQNTSQYVM